MGIAVNLDNDLVNIARTYSGAQSRSVPKQKADELTLISFAPHENFYENLKKQI